MISRFPILSNMWLWVIAHSSPVGVRTYAFIVYVNKDKSPSPAATVLYSLRAASCLSFKASVCLIKGMACSLDSRAKCVLSNSEHDAI